MTKEYRNVTKTKEVIRSTFSELLGEKRNMESITVKELTERANIAKSTFYNHYNDIYAVAEEFGNELIQLLSNVLDEIETEMATEYDIYIEKIVEFLRQNESTYRKVINSPDTRFFIEKLKTVLSSKVFEKNTSLPFSKNNSERYVQIRFLTNACVDTLVDYFNGTITISIEKVGNIIIDIINKLQS